MYQATIDGVHLCSTNSVGGFDCISDPVAKLIVNGSDSFDFVLYPQHPVYPDVVCKVSRVKIWQDNKLIFYGTVTGYSETMDGVRTYSCEGALAWLNELCVPSYHLSNATPEQALSWYIGSYNRAVRDPSKKFSLGTVTVKKAKRKDGTEGTIARSSGVHPSYWEEISQKLLDSFGGILRIRYSGADDCAGVIDWLAIPDATCDQDIRYAKNLMNCDWTYDATPIVTAVVPLGKKKDGSSEDDEFRIDIIKSNDASMTALLAQLVGEDYVKSGDMVYSKSRVEKYGLIQQTVTFDDESAPDTIAYLGAVWLKQNGMASSTVSAEAIDIADIDESVSHFVCGDYVRTQLPGYEEEQLFPVTSIEIPLAAPEDARLTVGTQESGIASGGTTTGGGSISDVGSGSDAMAHTHANKGVLDKITEQDYTDFKSAVTKAHTHDNKGTLDKLTPSVWSELMAAKNKAHTHSNKDTLDKIDETSWTRVYGMSHEHDNKDVLDQITQEEWKSINSAKNKAHTHDNKATLDKIDDVSWLTVYGQTHEHSNKDILDKITASYTTEEKTKLKGIADGAEVNQNAFSSIATGSAKYTASSKQAAFLVEGNGGTTVSLDTKTGRLTIASHQHSNQNILDQLNEEQWKIINSAANKAHVHDNKDTLDKITDALWNTVYSNTHTHDNKSVLDGTTASYTTVEKTKLAGIADGANKYVHPTTSGNKHIPSGGSSGQILRWSADGTAVWGADNNTTYSDATQSAHGLMTAADKKKLDGIAAGATKVAVDSALSATSTNPVQNKAVKAALDSKAASGHTHAMIINSALLVSGASNAAQWVKLGTLVSSGNFRSAVVRVWTGDGANARTDQNASFEIQIKDGWQSAPSPDKACGVTVYRINCGGVKVKVIPTAHDTYTVWVYLPWTYWNGNFSVYGKYKSWTSQELIQSEEPEGSAADTAYYDQAFLTSTVDKATEATTLTDSGWVDTTRNTTLTVTSTVKCRKYGQLVEVRGEVTFSSTYGSPTVCTLPAGYRPATVVQTCGYTPSGKIFGIKVDTAGVVSFSSDAAGTFVKSTTYRIDLTYLLG